MGLFSGILDFASSAGGGSILGGIASGLFGKSQAQSQMDYQTRMSDTAHQRQVKDLRAAGLNPILSATGGSGSSTPSGAMTSIDPVSSALQTRKLAQELKNMKALEEKTKSEKYGVDLMNKIKKPAAGIGDSVGDVIDKGIEKGRSITREFLGGGSSAKSYSNPVKDSDKPAWLKNWEK